MKFTAFFLLFAMLMMSLFNVGMVDARPPAPVPIPKAYAKARPAFFLAPLLAAARIARMRKP
ncbi:hypothetical protein GQ42DRAFT_161439 [Ramicandelaber brevisporus]|nr:hypothetical protein GQ42DRAFT_161439 [Ramicandelaber brevisporus]